MIHHVSISARDPKHVADVLAELMDGRAYPFPGGIANSFMAVSGDEHGTMIEVYPENVALVPGTDDEAGACGARRERAGYATVPSAAVGAGRSRRRSSSIGDREGWRTKYFGRGAPGQPPVFHVIEFWVENRLMIEVATPDMLAEYTRLIRFDALDAHFSATRRGVAFANVASAGRRKVAHAHGAPGAPGLKDARPIAPSLSLYLDLTRFTAALLVVLGHAWLVLFPAHPLHWPGPAAVIVFFVLSGFVIAYVTDGHDRTLADFTLNRLSRLWSVALPALVFGVVLLPLRRPFGVLAGTRPRRNVVAHWRERAVRRAGLVLQCGAALERSVLVSEL